MDIDPRWKLPKVKVTIANHCVLSKAWNNVKMLRVLFGFSPIAGQTSSPVPDPQNAQMITVNHQLWLSPCCQPYILIFPLSSNSFYPQIPSYPHILTSSSPPTCPMSHISSWWRLLLLPPLASVSFPVPAHVLNTTYSPYSTTYSSPYYTTRSCFPTFATSLRHLFQAQLFNLRNQPLMFTTEFTQMPIFLQTLPTHPVKPSPPLFGQGAVEAAKTTVQYDSFHYATLGWTAQYNTSAHCWCDTWPICPDWQGRRSGEYQCMQPRDS